MIGKSIQGLTAVVQGRFVHVPPSYPCSDFDMSFLLPWWKDPKYEV